MTHSAVAAPRTVWVRVQASFPGNYEDSKSFSAFRVFRGAGNMRVQKGYRV